MVDRRGATIGGTSWAQREALRALARACGRYGGPVPARRLPGAQHELRLGKLLDRGLVQVADGEIRTHRDLLGRQVEYVERVYEPTTAGRELLDRAQGESPPAPAALRDEHWTLLAILAQRGAATTAGELASRAGCGLNAQRAGQRLALLARHGYAESIGGGYMQPTRWVITPAGERAHAMQSEGSTP